MVNCLWIGTPEYSFYGVRAQATTTALGTARPEILVESSYVEGVDRIWTMTATGIDGPVISEDVKGVIAEANCNLDDHSRVDTEKNGDAAVFKSDLTWCVPYSYWRMDPFDCNHVTDVKEGAGAPWVGPSMAPTPLSLPPLATISWCPPYEYSLIDPTSETEVDRIKAAAGAPVDTSTATPTAGPTPQPAGAPPTDDSTHAPTAEPTPQACDSPEKFYPDTDHNLADEGSGPDGWKLTSEHSQKNPYSVVGFAAWADAGIAYGGFYGGDEVTCYDADCIKDALEKKSPLIIHLGQDIDLEDARYKIKGDKDHDDKTLEGHGFTLKYSGDDGEAPLFTDNGASNLVFRHVRFENTGEDSPAIQVRETSHHVVLDQCTFACSEPGKCGYAVTVEAPATFVTIQRCLFDQVKKGIRVRNKGDDNGAGRLTVVECYFRNCEKESPDAEVGWIHMASNVVEGGGDGDGMIKTDPEKGGVPELLVDGGRLSVAEGKLYKKSGGGLIAAVPGVTNSNPEAPDAPEDLSWCVPYDYTPIDGFDDAAVETLKQNAGAHPDEPGSEPTGEPTAEPTARPSSEPTGEPTAEPIPRPTIKPTTTPTPLPTAEPTATSTPAPTPAPTTPSPTSPAPTPYPTTPLPTLSCDSPEKFYPNTPNQNGDGYKLISEHSQMNPYNVTGFAAWADAGIAYGGFYGGNEVTCHDAKCLEEALIETDGPLIIHLGKDIDLGDARYKIMGSKDHDDKTLEGHGFTLKYSFDDGGEAPLFTDAGASNLVIRNVRFENTGDTKERPAIQIRDGAHHVVLDQCTFTCSYAGECGYAVTVEAPATFVTIQRCLFDRVEKGIHMRNKAPGDNGAGRVTVVESYFRKCEKESPDGEVGWIHMASCVIEGGGDGDGMIKTDPDNGGVPQILVDGGRLSVAEGKLYRKDGGGLIAAVSGVTNSDPEAPDAPGDLSWCPPYDYISIDGFDDAAVEKIKENAGAQKEFPACGVRINRGRGQDQNDFQCVTDPKKMEHDGRKIAFACCTAHICTRKDEDGKCYAGHLKQQSNFAPKDWHEATRACAAEGKVLCGVEEPCSRSGCSYDHHYQWTGQECQAGDANFPYECLWPGSVKVVPGIKGVAPYCEKNQSALVRDDGTDMGIAFACCNEDGSSGCTRKVDGSCNLCGNQPVRVQRWSSSGEEPASPRHRAGVASRVKFDFHTGCNAGDWRKEKGTWAPVSWADAMEHCATYGKTLCGSSDNARCQNRGCYYNNIYQWTNEQCEPPEPPPTCLVVAPITDSSECPDVCPPACKDVLVTGGQCSGDGVCAPDDQGVLCTCTPPSARRLLAEPKEEYVFDVTELGECVPCSGACEVGECVPDTRRRGLRFGMSTTGCCCGA